MSYTVFALKWRPKNFDEVIGQSHIIATLKSAIENNRLAHAYLFAGPRGVGKTSTARILAKALNCKEGSTSNPCQKCSSCLEISQGRSLDVMEIDGASNTSVDDIRTLRENVRFAPTSGRVKVYIIDEVHMLSTAAFNALLKTLEEPPPFVKFFFATTHPDKIPSTVLSRCQRLDFRRIPTLEIIAQLEKIVKTEKIDVDKEVLLAIAKSSDGALRDAESVLDQLFSFSQEKISLKDVISVLGLVEQDALFEITDKIIQKNPQAVLGLFNKIIDDGKDISMFLAHLIEHFRNLMIAKVTKADAKLIDLPEDICQRLLKQSQAFSLEEIFGAFNIFVATQEMSKRLDSLRIPLEVSLVRLAYDGKKLPVSTPVEPPHKPVEPAYREIKPASVAPKIVSSPLKKEEPRQDIKPIVEVSLDSIKELWQNVIENLKKIKISVATYLNEGEPLRVHEDVLVVSFPRNYSLHKEALERKDNKAIIEKAISEILKVNLRVNFLLSQEVKQKEDNSSHPFIKSALDMFGARLIKED